MPELIMRIELRWMDYRKRVLAPDATPLEIHRARFAFYSGARSLLGLFLDPHEATGYRDSADMLNDIRREIAVYFDLIAQRGARERSKAKRVRRA